MSTTAEHVAESGLQKLKRLMVDGDHVSALQLAAKWPRLGHHKDMIQRAWAAVAHPDFYRQLGEDPDKLVALGIQAIQERYGLQ